MRLRVALVGHRELGLLAQERGDLRLVDLRARLGELVGVALVVAHAHQRDPAGVGAQQLRDGGHAGLERLHGGLDLLAVDRRLRDGELRLGEDVRHLADEVGDALRVDRGERDARDAVFGGEPVEVDPQPAPFRDVHHVDGDRHGDAHVGELAGEEEVALEVGGVDDVHDEVGFAREQEVDGGALVLGVGEERVGAGQVDHADVAAAQLEVALLLLDGDAGPVAHALARAGEGVEQRRLPAVGVAGDRDGENLVGGHLILFSFRTSPSFRRRESL